MILKKLEPFTKNWCLMIFHNQVNVFWFYSTCANSNSTQWNQLSCSTCSQCAHPLWLWLQVGNNCARRSILRENNYSAPCLSRSAKKLKNLDSYRKSLICNRNQSCQRAGCQSMQSGRRFNIIKTQSVKALKLNVMAFIPPKLYRAVHKTH